MNRRILSALLLWGIGLCATAQVGNDTLAPPETIIIEKKGSIFSGRPGKSMLMSLVVPGSGQIYNKSYLRVPFVYAAVGGAGLLLQHNTRYHTCLKTAHRARIDGLPYTPKGHCDSDIASITDASRLRLLRDQANADRQLSIVIFSLAWLANGIDAFVDAHLKDFDIDDNLTIDIGPRFDADPAAPMRMGIFVQF